MRSTTRPAAPAAAARRAFTLIELLVVIGIIVVLIGILIPVVSTLRGSAAEASTKAYIASVAGAFDEYFNIHKAYPGPLPNNQVHTLDSGDTQPNIGTMTITNTLSGQLRPRDRITGNENSVLGIMGGLQLSGGNPAVAFRYDLVGKGAKSLNSQQPKQYPALMTDASLSSGHFRDDAGEADDTEIPDFVDRFPSPLPLLILRANPGRTSVTNQPDANSVITDGTDQRLGHYDISQIVSYTGAYTGTWPNLNADNNRVPGANARSIGAGGSLPEVYQSGNATSVSWKSRPIYHGLNLVTNDSMDATLRVNDVGSPKNRKYYYPYDAYAYFSNPSLPLRHSGSGATAIVNTPRQKDRYIIISAGKDRVYGTEDDITNFGAVVP